MILRYKFYGLVMIVISPTLLLAQSDELLTRIWAGEAQAQTKLTSVCGIVTETRTSKLMVKPMVLRGHFCAEGSSHFMMEYSEPNPMVIRLNDNYLNITIGTGKTEVMNIGGDVRRVQDSFLGENSMATLKKDFAVIAQEDSREYELRLEPRSSRLRHRFNYLVVKMNKRDFLPRSLELDGKSGVNSVFNFEITSTNKPIPESTFEVIRK